LEGSRASAEVVVPLVLRLLGPPDSVVDVGCGLGSWLAVFQAHGVRDVLGIDGDWADRSKLLIGPQQVRAGDRRSPLRLGRRCGLALSLEVAQHLPAACAEAHVGALTGLAPAVLFSAAVPYQGGVGHVNEQWPAYWARLFAARGYAAVDCLRRLIWDN